MYDKLREGDSREWENDKITYVVQICPIASLVCYLFVLNLCCAVQL